MKDTDKKEINVCVGQQIKRAREAAGLTQDKFSEMINLGTKHLSAIERGVAGISISTLQRICKTLCISSDSILMDELIEPDNIKLNLLLTQLKQLSPQQLDIALGINNKLLEAFALQEHNPL